MVGCNRARLCAKQGSSYLDKADWKTGRNKEKEETQGIYLVKSQVFYDVLKMSIATVKPKVCSTTDSFSSTNIQCLIEAFVS